MYLAKLPPTIYITCSLNLETFFKTMNSPNKDVTIDQVLSLYWSLMFLTTSIFVEIYDKNNEKYPDVWRIKSYFSNFFLFCIKFFLCISSGILLSISLQIVILRQTQKDGHVYKLSFVNRLNYSHPLLRSSS